MPENNQQLEQFKCTITHMFKGCPKENGWFGCYANRHRHGTIKLTGTTALNLTEKMQLDVKAAPKPNSYDDMEEYEAVEITVVTKDVTGIKRYLQSIKGISYATASRLVAVYGKNTLDKIKTDPDAVQNTMNMTDAQIKALTAAINSQDNINRLQQFLPEFAGNINMIKRILESCSPQKDPVQEIKDDPYRLIDIPGMTFPKADKIALRAGIGPFEPYRVNHGLVHLMETEYTNHLFINLSDTKQLQELYNRLEKKLNIQFAGIHDLAVRIQAFVQIENSPVHIETWDGNAHLYLKSIYEHVNTAVKNISRSVNVTPYVQKNNINVRQGIRLYENMTSLHLTNEHKSAVENAMSHKISVITGGPGTGKTSTVACIAKCWTQIQKAKIILLAPTGKATNKLQQATGNMYPAMTIDSMLTRCIDENNRMSSHNKFNNEQTMVIVDESSMVGIEKAAALLKCLLSCSFCFIGDIDQLPPINPGRFLKDIIDSGMVPVTYLTIPLRNSGLILSNAEKIKNNDTNLQYDLRQMPFYPQEHDDKATLQFILDQYNIERGKSPDITQLAIISPIKKGLTGTIGINMALQDIACPKNPVCQPACSDKHHKWDMYTAKGWPVSSTIYGNGTEHTNFRIGDIVINTKNMPQIETLTYTDDDYWNGEIEDRRLGIFNGDCGRIIAYAKETNSSQDGHDHIIVQMFDNRIAELDIVDGDFEPFELGYAITVHKAQGCEYDTVICIFPKSLSYLTDIGFATKNIAYTAITRAKKRVIIIGSKNALNACIEHDMPPCNSTVSERLRRQIQTANTIP